MKQIKPILFILFMLLLLVTACRGRSRQLPQVNGPDNLGEQAAVISTRAAEAAATAALVAATAAAQNGNLVATAQAANVQLPPVEVNALREKIASVQPDGDGNVSVIITDAELNQVIQAQQAAAVQAGVQPRIQDPQVVFTDGNIVLTGTIAEPASGALTVIFRPYVSNGLLQFEVVSASVGNIQVPAVLLDTAESTLNTTLGEAMTQLPANVVLKEIVMGQGTMTVMGGKT